MNRVIIFFIFLLVGCEDKEQERLYYIYKPALYGFSFTLPEGWQTSEITHIDNCIEIFCTDNKLTVCIFIMPYENTYPYLFQSYIRINNSDLMAVPSTPDGFYVYLTVIQKSLYFNHAGFCCNMSFEGEYVDYEAAVDVMKEIREGIFYEVSYFGDK